MKVHTAAIIGLSLVGPSTALAKPLSYVGGAMLMQENDSGGHTAGIDYTFSPQAAVALHVQRHTRGDNFTMLGPQFNALLKRWNLPEGQGNIFAMAGGGTSLDRGEMRPAAWTGLLADYETRRVFTSYEVRLSYAKRIEKSAWQRARIGWATEPVKYNEANIWLMLQVDRRDEKHLGVHHGSRAPDTEVTPLVRAIYKTFLIEGGVSNRGNVMFNWVQQF